MGGRPFKARTEKPRVRIPLDVAYIPRLKEFRAVFADIVLYLRPCPRLTAVGMYYRGGARAVFDASDAPLWNFNDEQQRFVDAIRIANAQ